MTINVKETTHERFKEYQWKHRLATQDATVNALLDIAVEVNGNN